jgi:hypothetical protein
MNVSGHLDQLLLRCLGKNYRLDPILRGYNIYPERRGWLHIPIFAAQHKNIQQCEGSPFGLSVAADVMLQKNQRHSNSTRA